MRIFSEFSSLFRLCIPCSGFSGHFSWIPRSPIPYFCFIWQFCAVCRVPSNIFGFLIGFFFLFLDIVFTNDILFVFSSSFLLLLSLFSLLLQFLQFSLLLLMLAFEFHNFPLIFIFFGFTHCSRSYYFALTVIATLIWLILVLFVWGFFQITY